MPTAFQDKMCLILACSHVGCSKQLFDEHFSTRKWYICLRVGSVGKRQTNEIMTIDLQIFPIFFFSPDEKMQAFVFPTQHNPNVIGGGKKATLLDIPSWNEHAKPNESEPSGGSLAPFSAVPVCDVPNVTLESRFIRSTAWRGGQGETEKARVVGEATSKWRANE